MFTHRPPFYAYGIPDSALQFRIYNGLAPMRPTGEQCHGHPISEDLWLLVEQCLKRGVAERATISAALAGLQGLKLRREADSVEELPVEGIQTASSTPPSATVRYCRT